MRKHVFFLSFTFNVFGFLALETIDLLHKIQIVMHNNVMSSRFINVMLTKIDFVIQKT